MTRAPRILVDRAGVTLIELAVTLAILGVAATVTGLAVRAMPAPGAAERRAGEIATARRRALADRHPVEVDLTDSSGARLRVVAFPDGRVLGDSALEVDPLSGRPRDASR